VADCNPSSAMVNVMRADPTDRVMSVEGPEISPVSVPRIFAAGLALPFVHPLRLIVASILPALLIGAVGLGPLQRIIALWQAFAMQTVQIAPSDNTGTAMGTTLGTTTTAPPPEVPANLVGDVLTLQGVLFLALAVWLCTWQRAAARDFAEPFSRWFGMSLLRLPGYILALLVWVLAPALVILVPFIVMVALIALNAGAGWAVPAQEVAGEMTAIPGMLSDLQWLVLAVAFLVVALIALWLNARLSPLPALVASQGWRRAVRRAWELSYGHGLGLSVSMLTYAVLTFALMVIAGVVAGAVVVARAGGGVPDPATTVTVGSIVDLVGTALLAIWQASLGALVVRDGLSPAEALDPTMFD
jgi:hypothetical protein